MIRVELRNISTFLKIVELGQFSRAAEALGYAQSTVTTQLHQLEREMGGPLLTRNNSSVELTEFGRQFLPLAQEMQDVQLEMETLRTGTDAITGTLRVGVIESLLYSDFLKLVSAFSAKLPLVNLEFFTASSLELHRMLTENRLDMAVCFAQAYDYSSLDVVQTKSARVLFATTPSNPLAKKRKVTLDDLSSVPLIMTEEISVYHQALHTMMNAAGLVLRHRCKVQSSHAIKQLVLMTDGVCYLPEYALADELATGRMVALSTDFAPDAYDLIVAIRKERWHSPQLREMLQLAQESDWLTGTSANG